MQISYHSTLIKIQNLQNLKNIFKKLLFFFFFWVPVETPEIDQYGRYLKTVRNVDVLVSVQVLVQHILAISAGTVWYRPPCSQLTMA